MTGLEMEALKEGVQGAANEWLEKIQIFIYNIFIAATQEQSYLLFNLIAKKTDNQINSV